MVCIFICPPPVWDGVCRTGLTASWHPAAPCHPAACPGQMPGCRTLFWQKYHYHLTFQALSSLWYAISSKHFLFFFPVSLPLQIPMPGRRSYFSFFYYDSLSDLPTDLSALHPSNYRQIFHGEAKPLIIRQTDSPGCVRSFVSLKIFRTAQTAYVPEYHHTDIQFSRYSPAGGCQPAKKHLPRRMPFGRLQQPAFSYVTTSSMFPPPYLP